MNLLTNIIGKHSKPFVLAAGFIVIGFTGIIDFLTGYELSFSLFYVISISFVTWFAGREFGLLSSLASAIVWYIADIATGHPYSSDLIPIFNSLLRLTLFIVITLLLSSLKSTTEREKALSRIDYLTGAVNARRFYELLQMEIDRFQRYGRPFSLAYIDLDNFKSVNDQFGHAAGDQVLCAVVDSAARQLRKTDVLARLGGDEFALLLPETGQKAARVTMSKIHGKLVEDLRLTNWPVTFSIGVVTCHTSPGTPDQLVKMADDLMYSVKHENKNAIKYFTYQPKEGK